MEGKEGDSENQSTKQDPDGFQVHVQLPTGETASFQAKRSSSVRDLKIIVEVNSGVPSDLFTLVHNQGENNAVELKDQEKMADIDTRADVGGSMTFDLSIPPWWQRFVDRCMKRDNRQIIKRISIKMNQISSEERAFVAAFIAAQKGDGQLFQCLLNGDVKFDIEQTVQCSGRTLLHAAMTGGNFSCVAAIFMNGGSCLLSRADHQGVTPVDIATSSNQPELVDLLAKYVELKVRESSEDDGAVGKSSEDDLKKTNDSSVTDENHDGGGSGEINTVEGSKNNDAFLQNESKENSADNESNTQTSPDESMKEEVGKAREVKNELSEKSSPASVSPQTMSKRSPNPQLKVHMPLRGGKSLNTQDRPLSAKSKLICVEEIRPLNGKAVVKIKQSEERLPRVNTPPSSPMNSPRMGRKFVPSLLNVDKPGSPILRPRSPSHPCPRSPTFPRPRFPTVPRPDSPGGSPAFRRRAFRFPSTSESQRTRAATFHDEENEPQRPRTMSYHGEARTRKMSSEMKDFLMLHYSEPRENRPWNAWKTVRKNQMDLFDVSDDDDDDSSSEDEEEKLARYLQTSISRRRKTFDMWMTDKEAELARRQLLSAEKAKQEEIMRRKEANWRQLTGKTHGQWLEEKSEFKAEEVGRGKPAEQSETRKALKRYQEWVRSKNEEALAREERWRREAMEKLTETKQKRDEQSEARKAAATKKYEEWLRSKNEEALALEDQLRREAATKFSETKQKRDEKRQKAWFKKKLFDMS